MVATDEEAAFLRAITASPDDDTPRLVYADWLTENGQSDRAEFIRAQIEYTPLHAHATKHRFRKKCQRCQRTEELSEVLQSRFKVPSHQPLSFATDCPHRLMGLDGYTGLRVEWDWHRGFVSNLRTPASLWLAYADTLLAHHPIRHVTLTTYPNGSITEVSKLRNWKRPPTWGVDVMDSWRAEWTGTEFVLPPDLEVAIEPLVLPEGPNSYESYIAQMREEIFASVTHPLPTPDAAVVSEIESRIARDYGLPAPHSSTRMTRVDGEYARGRGPIQCHCPSLSATAHLSLSQIMRLPKQSSYTVTPVAFTQQVWAAQARRWAFAHGSCPRCFHVYFAIARLTDAPR